MEKRTILAIVLSMMVMFGFMLLQNVLYPPPEPAAPPIEQAPPVAQAPLDTFIPDAAPLDPLEDIWSQAAPETAGEEVLFRTERVETDLLEVTLSNAGGNITSFRLKRHMDGPDPVEMIFVGEDEPQAFAVAFGNWEDVLDGRVSPVDRNFRVQRVSEYIVEFSQDFASPGGGIFTLTKRYEFIPGEYMFELNIALSGSPEVRAFDFQGAAYTLVFGPQIGPSFERLTQRQEYRNYLTYRAGRMRTERVSGAPLVINNQPAWAAIAGKYFTLIALPYASQFDLIFSTQAERGLPDASRLFISRPAISGSRLEDRYHFYLGPKSLENLNIYDRGDNAFRLRETGLIEVASTRGFLAPLERILKWFLQLFFGIIPNYGVAIILLTVLVKVVMFPLTKKGSESTMRMQTLSPKIKELQEKYKDNKQKLNAEMAEFYKREGYNPLSGCLPMLIQLPIFIAMFNLFNSHFELRGAVFIPGWIPDLSVPEFVYEFPEGVTLPMLGWTALRLLPFIYVGSQLLYGKVTQTPDQKGNPQMKIMLYAMPIVFFFVLYDMPSGLLVYWIMSNVLTMVQQLGINKYIARKKAAAAVTEGPPPVIAPVAPKAKKKKKK